MELSSEDALCLNVLMSTNVQAIRINESSMTVHGLTDQGEATVTLHPNCRHEQYLKQVRETLSEHALDSPGGYPVYLRRWSRMGQLRDETLPQLLLTGEPEAVVAVVHAQGLTDELARRAWWIMPTAEIARRMLERPAVAQGNMGKVLADFLIEFLPFEEDHYAIIETIRFLLYSGLVDEDTRNKLWKKGRNKNAYYVGFLEQTPDALPSQVSARADWESFKPALATLIAQQNPYALLVNRALSATGQTFLFACDEVIRNPAAQEVVNVMFNALGNYFRCNPGDLPYGMSSMDDLTRHAEQLCAAQASGEHTGNTPLQALLLSCPELKAEIFALLILSGVSTALVEPIFARTTAIGTLMRTKLEPVTVPLLHQIAILRGKATSN